MGFKGITWVGDIYQKFEDMCLEAEEVMYEDTVKYVESQVQTVGASVKKLYSDVMQDLLLPCYIDPLEVTSKQFPVSTDMGIFEKPKENTKEDLVKVKDDKQFVKDSETSNVNHSSYFAEHHSKDHLPTPYSESSVGGARLTFRRKLKRNSHLSSASVNLGLKDFSKASLSSDIGSNHEAVQEQIVMTSRPGSVQVKEADSGGENVSTNNVSSTVSSENASRDHFTPTESCLNEETEVRSNHSSCEPGSCTSNDGLLSGNLCANVDTQQCKSSAETGSFRTGIPGECDVNLIEENGVVEPGHQLGDKKLEETCVLVEDGDRTNLVSGKEHAPSSYKKKMKKAFSWRGSARKQEYKQLAAEHGNMRTWSDHEAVEVPKNMAADSKCLPSHGSCESEWELL